MLEVEVRSLFRFYVVAPPVPPLMSGTFLVLVAVAAGVLAVDPARGGAAVMPVMALQLFAAASGFSTPARRGHYDLLLTGGTNRLFVVLVHWGACVAPGTMAWLLVGLMEMAASGVTRFAAFSSGTVAGMTLVSTLPWALSAVLPRFSASIGWLLVLVTIVAVAPAGAVEEWLRSTSDGAGGYASAAVFLLYPAVAIGRDLGRADVAVVVPGLVVSVSAMFVSCRGLARAAFPLEAAQ